MHKTSGRWRLGLALSLTTALMWGLLGIALKVLLEQMDPYSISWYRFIVASVLLGGILYLRGSFPDWRRLHGKFLILMIVTTVALSGNFVIYLFSLDYISPGLAQVLIQLAPVFLLLGSLIIYKESFTKWQWLGLLVLIIGMLLFMNQRLDTLFSNFDDYSKGVVIMIVAALVWAIYALLQKQLLTQMRSESILFWVYVGSTVLLFPTVELNAVASLDTLGWWLLAFCCVNSVIAYGCFAEALDHWEASRVSAVLTLVPLITLLFVAIIHYFYPQILASENLNLLAYVGAFLVVGGSAMTALAGQKKKT